MPVSNKYNNVNMPSNAAVWPAVSPPDQQLSQPKTHINPAEEGLGRT